MCKQLELFPEITTRLGCTIDDLAEEYIKSCAEPEKETAKKAFKEGALTVLGDVIDIIRKYTTVYEA